MKKVLFIFTLVVFCSFSAFSQEAFNGIVKINHQFQMEMDIDIIVKNMKENIDNNKQLNVTEKAAAKMFAKPLVKNMLKKYEQTQYTISYPNGEFITYTLVDSKNNRSIEFIPSLGRIDIRNTNSPAFITVFPKLKLAFSHAKSQLPTFEKTPQLPFQKIEEINGFKAVDEYVLMEKDKIAGDADYETMTRDGIEYYAIPTGNKVLADYQGIAVLANQNVGNEMVELTGGIELLELIETSIDERNFQIPADIKILDGISKPQNLSKFNKKVKAALDELPVQVGDKLPDVLWDLFKE